ncbi:hypothetical protein OG601_47320 [Streptomyces sp. NBC_01239]|uniref:hypothetical protein n=1 Tax=Streptomyces sp. NBC_01239 TaxID=2903792 RepID=UPI00224D6C74|nr:hypothetical protein [Streptomyces sp. NBC_01239]MCX4816738.1 hypothetical protein [Streptomyces sp. NBC_01239]MCX4818186.1 hypothetical protein [Streptomyces sp. NBC_01239]
MTLGTVVVHDARQDIEHRLDIKKIAMRDGALQVEAHAVMRHDGSVEDGDVISIYGPDRRIVTRYWLSLPGVGYSFVARDRFTLLLPISLGGPGGMAFADATLLDSELDGGAP